MRLTFISYHHRLVQYVKSPTRRSSSPKVTDPVRAGDRLRLRGCNATRTIDSNLNCNKHYSNTRINEWGFSILVLCILYFALSRVGMWQINLTWCHKILCFFYRASLNHKGYKDISICYYIAAYTKKIILPGYMTIHLEIWHLHLPDLVIFFDIFGQNALILLCLISSSCQNNQKICWNGKFEWCMYLFIIVEGGWFCGYFFGSWSTFPLWKNCPPLWVKQ